MKAKDLISVLQQMNPEMEIFFMDGAGAVYHTSGVMHVTGNTTKGYLMQSVLKE